MSARQIRLSDKTEIRSRIKNYLGKKISIIRRDNMVFYGVLEKINEGELTLLNMRLEKMILPIDDISELYTDIPA